MRQVEEIKKEVVGNSVAGSDDDVDEDSASVSEEDESESEDDGADGSDAEAQAALPNDESTGRDKNAGVKTKYDRMFNRKSQTVLSDHYSKLIAHSDSEEDEDGSAAGAKSLTNPGGNDDGDADDFLTLKRADHDIVDAELPTSHHLSKRKLRMGASKKAMLSQHGNPSKLVFDDDGAGHELYELIGEDEFKAAGDAKEQRAKFVEAEQKALAKQDLLDKERAKDMRREKKRKRKAMENGENVSGGGVRVRSLSESESETDASCVLQYNSDAGEGVEIASLDGDEDDAHVEPSFDELLGSDPSDDDGEAWYNPEKERAKEKAKEAKASNKKRRVQREEEAMPAPVDLEALALKALGRR